VVIKNYKNYPKIERALAGVKDTLLRLLERTGLKESHGGHQWKEGCAPTAPIGNLTVTFNEWRWRKNGEKKSGTRELGCIDLGLKR